MGKTLVLTEKPSVAREIARVLGCNGKGEGCINGNKYVVTWALGHLVTLADPETYDEKYKHWRLEDLPMLPQKMKLVVMKQTKKQFSVVSSLMKRADIDEVVIATDAGREGELVARWIMMKAGCKKPAKRLWISSQTDRAIREGFQNLKPASDYDNLYYSAQARAEADWLVGLNVTRALTCKYNAQLSAGRVQTPTLSLIVEREKEILAFKPKEYYTIQLVFDGFTATYRDSKGNSRFYDKEQAQRIIDEIQGKSATVAEIKKEYKHQAPPAAYDLTELQRDANKRYSYSAKQTLNYMQSLYETHKLLTYPRTDSRYITDDVVATIPERLRSIAVGPYTQTAMAIFRKKPLNTKYIVNNAKVTDHHAIIPTEEPVNLARLSHEERNIYDLVVKRFLEVLSDPFEYDEVKLQIKVDRHSFYATGKVVRAQGWKAISGRVVDDDDESAETNDQQLPALTSGMKLSVKNIKTVSGKTKPPARYTEATLLSAMENPSGHVEDKTLRAVLQTTSGLGTPATRADIIEKLFDNFSIERNGREIRPTAKGEQLVKIVPPDLKSAELTAKWEQQLQNISRGQASMSAFIAEMRRYSSSLVSEVIASEAQYKHENMTKEKCPECGKYLLEVNGKKGKLLVCQDRECGFRRTLTQETNARCPNCMKRLEIRGEGEKRMFACAACGYRERLTDYSKRKQSDGATNYEVKSYLSKQGKKDEGANNPFADLLKDWGKK